MKHIIKLRIWHREFKRFLTPDEWFLNLNGELYFDEMIVFGKRVMTRCNPKHYVIQQYTGHIDKNGKEIFEGDYIYYGYGSSYETLAFKVVWSPAKLGWVFKHDEYTYLGDGWTPHGNRFSELYVIGNIFEGVKSVGE